MKSFEYAAPKTLKEAAELLGDKWGETEILAGGTDLVTSLKQNITEPKRVVSLRNIAELKGVEIEQKGVRIGAMTTLAELAGNKNIKEHFPSLVTAANGVGSPQLLSVGTVGGDLCQRPRCWYFRNGFGLFAQHEGVSLAREGENRYHAIFANEGPALFVSPSSFGPAFIALGALRLDQLIQEGLVREVRLVLGRMLVEERHKRAVGDEGRDAVGFIGREFERADP